MKRTPLLIVFSLIFLMDMHVHASAGTVSPNSPNSEPDDKLTIEALAAGIGGFLAWASTTSVGFLLTRRCLLTYLVITFNSQVREYRDTEALLADVMRKHIVRGSAIDWDAAYTKGDITDFTEVRPECLTYLKRSELIRVTEVIHRLDELEALLEGFFSELTRYKSQATILKDDDITYWECKYRRIQSYFNALPKNISHIAQLPSGYPTILGAESFISTRQQPGSQEVKGSSNCDI